MKRDASERPAVQSAALSAPADDTHHVLAPRPSREERFRIVYESQLAYVWNSLRRLGVAPSDLEDVAHEMFVTIFRKLDEYEEDRPLRPWLFAFAHRFAADYRRRAHRRYELSDDSPSTTAIDPSTRHEDRDLLVRALAKIDLDRAAVLVMIDVDGFTAVEAAEMMKIPLNTVYSRLRTAREELAHAIAYVEQGGLR